MTVRYPSWIFPGLDEAARRSAAGRQEKLMKPRGSLGMLEEVVLDLAAIQRRERPRSRPAAAIVFASDHPVTRHGVSAYPSSFTAARVNAFVDGGAAATVLCRSLGIPLHVVDVGVENGSGAAQGADVMLVRDMVADDPVGDLRIEDAMSPETYLRALDAGRHAVERLFGEVRILILGDTGIGNSTAASAVVASLLGGDPADFVGRGTGVDDAGLANKRDVVREAVTRIAGESDPHGVVRRVGGRDIAALVGAMAAAIERGMAILVDGFIVSTAALVLHRLDPKTRPFLLFAHASGQPGQMRVLAAMNAKPLLELSMRLGEGTGALIALPLIDAACRLHEEMARTSS
jgi:nicotinate-nucleotide--dimethylbenzimidazole phosphoribosyltransferase